MKCKRLAFCLSAFALLALLPSLTLAQEGEYLFILKGRGNVFWKVLRQGVEETAKAMHINAIILNTDDDQTPEAQLNMCLASLARKPKALVLGAATKAVGIECFKKAAEMHIPAADVDGNVTIEDAKAAGIPLAFSVGSDNILIGKQAADYLASKTAKNNPSILVIKGLPGSIVSEKRAQGFLDEIKKMLPQAKVVGSPSADWDRMKAMNTAIDFIQRETSLDYIFSVSDVMTMGVVEGLKVAGKSDTIKILSVDGIADARKLVADELMMANVAQLPYLMGKRAVELSLAASSGQISYMSEFTATPTLTKEVLEKKNDPNLQFLR